MSQGDGCGNQAVAAEIRCQEEVWRQCRGANGSEFQCDLEGRLRCESVAKQTFDECKSSRKDLVESTSQGRGSSLTGGIENTSRPPSSNTPPATKNPPQNGAQDNADTGLAATLTAQLNATRQELTTCRERTDRAHQCCAQPMNCTGDIVGLPSGVSSALGAGLQLLGMHTTFRNNQNIEKMCADMKKVANVAAGMNLAYGAVCSTNVQKCRNSCGDLKERLEQIRSQANAKREQLESDRSRLQAAEPTTANTLANEINALREVASTATSRMNAAEGTYNRCEVADNASVQAGLQAIASRDAARSAEMCRNLAANQLDPQNQNNLGNTDCSTPGAYTNPVCQQMCSRPGTENDPICINIRRLMNQNQVNNTPTRNSNGGANGRNGDAFNRFAVDNDFEEEQLPNIGEGNPQRGGLNTVQGGTGGVGGGGLPAPVGGGGGGAMGSGGGSSSGDGNILKGLSSGNGYSPAAFRAGGGGGGFSGYGSGRAPASEKVDKINLRDFLPGGKNAPKRGLAGLSGGNPEIGPVTDDIFKRISNRYYALCLQDRLFDCEGLKRLKRGPK
jgi:hypothetical protein